MSNLSVNLNKIALLRNQRACEYPSVVSAAMTIVSAGANGLTVHPRPDERHITIADVKNLKALWQSQKIPNHIEYNIEGYPSPEWLALVKQTSPAQATLVPDPPSAHTSDKGWDLQAQANFLKPIIADLQEHGIRVSLFIDPEDKQVKFAKELKAERIELFTGNYALEFAGKRETAIAPYVSAAKTAQNIGIEVNAGHDLNLDNLPYFAGHIANLAEVSIGHAFTADALWLGLDACTKAYLKALN